MQDVTVAKMRIVANGRSAEDWAAKISAAWQHNVSSIFTVGNMLEAARDELGNARFLVLRRDALKYSKATVIALIRVATDTKLRDVDHGTLPASWRTLYALARLTDDQFSSALESGAIHPGMERKDVAALRPKKEKPEKKEQSSLSIVERITIDVRKIIVGGLKQMSVEEKKEFISLVRFQLDQMENPKLEAVQ